jgi:hypothetical protein
VSNAELGDVPVASHLDDAELGRISARLGIKLAGS